MNAERIADSTGSQGRSWASTMLMVMAVIALALIDIGIVASRQYFANMFDEFGLKTSVVTRLALSPITPVLLAALLLATLGKEWAPGLRRVAIAWNIAVLCLAPLVLAFYVVGIFEPLMALIKGLSD